MRGTDTLLSTTQRHLLTVVLMLSACASGIAIAQSSTTRAADPELRQLYRDAGINPFDAISANNLAMRLIGRGEYEKAEKLLARARRLQPDLPEIQRNVDRVRELIEQRAQLRGRSREVFRESFTPLDVPYVMNAWRADSGPASGELPTTETDLSDTQGAVPDADNPFDPSWLLQSAALKSRRGDHRAALVDLQRARALNPELTGVDEEIRRLEAVLPERVAAPESTIKASVPSSLPQVVEDIELPAPSAQQGDDDSSPDAQVPGAGSLVPGEQSDRQGATQGADT